MAPLNTFAVLGLVASALALPHTDHASHAHATGTHKHSGTGVGSHHLPSGTRASSAVSVHSRHSHSSKTVVNSTVESVATATAAQYNAASADAISHEDACSTVTTKIQVTVTVTVGEASSTAAAASSSSLAVSSSSDVVTPTVAGYFAGHHDSSKAAYSSSTVVSSASSVISSTTAVTSTTQKTTSSVTTYADKAHAPVLSLPAFSAPIVSVSAIVPTTTAHPALTVSSTAAATTTAAAYNGQGKRGLAYNTASLAAPFVGSDKISWAYNWGSSSSGLSSSFKYIPTLWGNATMFTDSWVKNANAAIASGSTHLFSFNEPELAAQANLSPADAAGEYKKWMNGTFAGKGPKLCAPSVTNGVDPNTGLLWLKSFMAECVHCQIDCINIHWYGDEASNLIQHVKDTIAVAGDREIWLTEFALNGTPSDATISSFLKAVMPYLDSNVAGYAYYMLKPGALSNGNSLNAIGSTYMSYTA